MPNLTKQTVLDYLKKKSDDKVDLYWRIRDWLRDSDEKYQHVFFKGNRYSAVFKEIAFLLSEGTDLFGMFDFIDQYYDEDDEDCQYDTFEDSVEYYIDRFFGGDSTWLIKVNKPIII